MNYPEFRNWALVQGAGVIGTNPSDTGECVGMVNSGELKIRGLLYPIQGVMYAKDFLNGNNTRPDIYERVINDVNNKSQLPSEGDLVVLLVNDWRGHLAYVNRANLGNGCVEVLEQWQGVKPHLAQYSYYKVVGWWHIKVTQGSSDMAEIINLDTRRIIAHGILGRNGKAGRSNALDGSSDGIWGGQALTNQFVQDVFLSAESRQWRDSNDPNSFNEMQKRYDAYPVLAKTVQELQVALANEQAKPPKEVIKEVEKIVTQYVDRPVYIEVEPSWLIKVREAIKAFLKIK